MRKFLPSIILLASVTLFTGCYTAIEEQFEHGNYDSVLRSSLEKMKRSRKRDDYINLALGAYQKAMDADKQRIAHLKANNQENQNWGKVYYAYNSMISRQEAVMPYLPIHYTSGKAVNVEMFDLRAVQEEAREGAAAYHYYHAGEWLKQDSRKAGRHAFSHLQKINNYYFNSTYKDAAALRNQAIDMGTNKVLIIFKPSSHIYLPEVYVDELTRHDYEGYVGDWTRLYRDPGALGSDSLNFDYAIEVTIESIDVSPQHVKEIHYDKHKEVEDGVKPLIGTDGEYVVDTLGNIVQVPNFVTLTCHVTEWAQHRSASVATAFEIYDVDDHRLAVRQRLEDHAVFENIYANANGHLSVLPREIKHLLNNHPLPFPTDQDMILLTSESLKNQIANAIRRNDDILAAL